MLTWNINLNSYRINLKKYQSSTSKYKRIDKYTSFYILLTDVEEFSLHNDEKICNRRFTKIIFFSYIHYDIKSYYFIQQGDIYFEIWHTFPEY